MKKYFKYLKDVWNRFSFWDIILIIASIILWYLYLTNRLILK